MKNHELFDDDYLRLLKNMFVMIILLKQFINLITQKKTEKKITKYTIKT